MGSIVLPSSWTTRAFCARARAQNARSQRRLPDARHAVHHGDERAALVEQLQEGAKLLVAADEGADPLVEDLLEGPRHAVVLGRRREHTLERSRPATR